MSDLARGIGAQYLNTNAGTQNNNTGSGTQYNAQTQNFYPERPETPPSPSAVVPFGRDPDFIEPGTLLEQIDRKCAVPGSRTALVGLGGVGKSQLAIEHCYRVEETSPEAWVFWVHASNAARFEQSYRNIANCVKVTGRESSKADIFRLVHNWLQDHGNGNGRWLLVLDNVDDASFLLQARSAGRNGATNSVEGQSSRPLIDYIPRCRSGSVLITTRSKTAALQLVEQREIVEVEPMKERDALALLQKKLGPLNDSDEVAELAAALEYMPLAMVQAAAYILQRAPRCSVRKYLEEFRTGDREKTTLLDHDAGQLRRDHEAKNAIIITWQISFDHIQRVRPSAAGLLSLMSLFDRQGIPEELVHCREDAQETRYILERAKARLMRSLKRPFHHNKGRGKGREEYKESRDDRNEMESDLLMLRNYSFIALVEDGATFEMHSLVQLATRMWLEANGRLEQWKQRFVGNLYIAFPTGEYENWTACQALFAHAKSAAAQKPKSKESLEMWATILYRAAWYAEQMGNWVEAEEMSVVALKTRKKLLGAEHEDTLWSMSLVGGVHNLKGEWQEAESLQVQVMETRKSKLGADHPDTLTSMGNLASTYSNQGRWEEAESLKVQVVETRKSKLGADHPDTLTSMGNLASTYSDQGRWEEAESLKVQVVETRKSKLGADHPDTLTSMGNLASTYSDQGRWEEAESLKVQVVETRKSKLGADHPDTLTSMNNLAFTLKNRGEVEKATRLIEECVEKRKQVLGPNHPDTRDSEEALSSWRVEALDLGSENESP